MSRPLVISDCDEVLLYMVAPFRDWLHESQGVRFEMVGNDFAGAMKYADGDTPVPPEEIWRLLRGFFDTEMHRQTPIPGAVEGMARLAEHADVVILTNLTDERQLHRTEQLAAHGIHARVFTNQGPKGPALARIVADAQLVADDHGSDLGAQLCSSTLEIERGQYLQHCLSTDLGDDVVREVVVEVVKNYVVWK